MHHEHLPQPNQEPENNGKFSKKVRKLGLSMALLFGAGSMADKVAGKNSAEKIGSNKPAAEFKIENSKKRYEVIGNEVVKSGADTYKSEGNMGMERDLSDEMELEPIVVTAPRYRPEIEDKKNSGDKESFKVQKSGADTLKSDQYEH